ncbi:MAG: FAD-dependent oxidoreductase, partial [Shewanella sp.]
MSKTQDINAGRRQLLKGGMVMAAGLGASMALPATASCASAPVNFDEIVDVLVVGSGFAGMSAALQAREAGVSVMVIDKMPVFGGNSTINGGAMAVAGSPLQKQAGIEDSVDAMVADMLRAGRGMNDVEMLKLVCNGTAESCQWLIDYGVHWKPFVQHFGGHSVQRVLQTVESSGAGIIRPLIKAARDKGVIMKNQTKLEGFVQDDAGRVIGVEVREGFYFPNERTGKIRRIGARRGVIMATGGFGRDIEYRMMQLPELNSDLDSTNHAGATSEALKQMMLIGANP